MSAPGRDVHHRVDGATEQDRGRPSCGGRVVTLGYSPGKRERDSTYLDAARLEDNRLRIGVLVAEPHRFANNAEGVMKSRSQTEDLTPFALLDPDDDEEDAAFDDDGNRVDVLDPEIRSHRYTLMLGLPSSARVNAVFESAGDPESGYSWGRLAEKLVSKSRDGGTIRIDPEAGTFFAYSTERAPLVELGRSLAALHHSPKRLERLVRESRKS